MTRSAATAKLTRVLAVVRKLDKEMPAHQMLALLFVAENPGCSIHELLPLLGVTSPTGTRVTTRLGDGCRGTKGLGLLRVEVDPRDRRLRQCTLTRKGTELVETIKRILGD